MSRWAPRDILWIADPIWRHDSGLWRVELPSASASGEEEDERKEREDPPNFRVENQRENTTDLGGSREPCPSCKTPGKGHFSDRSSYLVDPASSHMLVSKIKPCMSKYKLVSSETADGSLNQLWFIGSSPPDMDNCGNSRANTCVQAPTFQKACFY